MYLPKENTIEMQNYNKIFYRIIIPRAFILLDQSMKIKTLDSYIISDYRIISNFYMQLFGIDFINKFG